MHLLTNKMWWTSLQCTSPYKPQHGDFPTFLFYMVNKEPSLENSACEVVTAQKPCSTHYSMSLTSVLQVNGYVCECLSGWTGPDCETSVDDCVGVTCANGGRCEDMHNNYRSAGHCFFDCLSPVHTAFFFKYYRPKTVKTTILREFV